MGQKFLFNVPERDMTKEKDRKPPIVNNSNMVINVAGGNMNFRKIETIIQVSKGKLNKVDYQKDIELVTSEKRFMEYMDNYRQNGIGAIDTETEGLNPIKDKIAGLCLYTPGEKSIYVPINHIDYITGTKVRGQIEEQLIIEELNKVREARSKNIFHNADFDIRMLRWQLGKYKSVQLKAYWDTQFGGHLLNENEPHGLKELFYKYCKNNDKITKLNTFGSLFSGIKFTWVPIDGAYLYAAYNPLMTYDVYEFQKSYLDGSVVCIEHGLEDTSKLYFNIELPLIEVVANIEDTGVEIDVEYAKTLSAKYHKKLDDIREKINMELNKLTSKIEAFKIKDPEGYEKLNNPINIGSPIQLAILLYDVLGLKSPDRKSPRGTGVDILEKIKHPICKMILEWRGVSKLLTTYIDKIPELVSDRTGKLHAKFNQLGPVTGRFSSSDPNLQNIPSHNTDIRKMFIAGDGYLMISGDYSQQEPRTTAFLSQDENMLEAYRTGRDIYATIASMAFNRPYKDCLEKHENGDDYPEGKMYRGMAKVIVLALTYSMGDQGLANDMHTSIEEARRVMESFFEGFPKVKKVVDETLRNAKETGFVQTIWGRKRRLLDLLLPPISVTDLQGGELDIGTELKWKQKVQRIFGRKQVFKLVQEAKKQGIKISDNREKIAKAERQTFNAVIQGSAADMSKKAMLNIARNLELKALGYKMIIPVHDEIIGICPEENIKECAKLVEKCMIEAPTDRMNVPMKVDISVTHRWYGKEISV